MCGDLNQYDANCTSMLRGWLQDDLSGTNKPLPVREAKSSLPHPHRGSRLSQTVRGTRQVQCSLLARVVSVPAYAEDMDREEIAQGCLDQAGWAARLGSPMYEALLRRVAENARAGGPCLAALEPYPARQRMLAPLLLLAGIHRMVLEGRLPEAERFYPSTGGHVNVDGLWPHFLEAVPRAVLPGCVQTNEIGRSRARSRDSSKSPGVLASPYGCSKSARAPG
jgi:hypothetical protein